MNDSRIRQVSVFFIMAAIVTISAWPLLAAEPQPAAPAEANSATPNETTRVGTSTTQTLDVNAAEMLAKGESIASTGMEKPVLKPMTLEINAVLATVQQSLADLQNDFDTASDETSAMEIVRRIETLKINAELDILRVQLKYAIENGQAELVQQLETDLEFMTTPRPRKQPIDRSATSADNR